MKIMPLDERGKPGPIFIYPGEQIEVHGPDDSDVIGKLEMNQRGQLGFFRTDGIMLDLSPRCAVSGSVPLDTIFAEILHCRSEQDHKHGGPNHDDTHTIEDWIRFVQKFTLRALNRSYYAVTEQQEYETNLIHVASLAIAAIESSRRIRASLQSNNG
jgi:hypothetical protein